MKIIHLLISCYGELFTNSSHFSICCSLLLPLQCLVYDLPSSLIQVIQEEGYNTSKQASFLWTKHNIFQQWGFICCKSLFGGVTSSVRLPVNHWRPITPSVPDSPWTWGMSGFDQIICECRYKPAYLHCVPFRDSRQGDALWSFSVPLRSVWS